MSAYLEDNKEQAFSHINKQHYPDTYKKPNHPTFSDESIYSTKETPGGHWGHQNSKDVFYPSEWQIETFGNNYILDGMKQQGDGDVIPVRMGGVMLPEVDVYPQKFEEGGDTNVISDLNVDSPYIKEGYTDEQINDLFKQSDWYKEYRKNGIFEPFDEIIIPQIQNNQSLLQQYEKLKYDTDEFERPIAYYNFLKDNNLVAPKKYGMYDFGMNIDVPYRQKYMDMFLNEHPELLEQRVIADVSDQLKGLQFAVDYYNSEGFKQRANNANLRYFKKLYDTNKPVLVNPSITWLKRGIDSSYALRQDDANNISLGIFDSDEFNKAGVAAHEAGHFQPLFNTRETLQDKGPMIYESPYYNNNYNKIPMLWANWLAPTVLTNDHDFELSENYSDLMSLRQALFEEGIFDSTKKNKRFTRKDLKKFLRTERSKKERFLRNHNTYNTIKAINDIAQNNQQQNNVLYAANGGYLDNLTTKPFSYQPIPEVRYEEGGFLHNTIKWLGSLFGLNQDETQQNEGIDLREIAARQAYAESGYDSNAKSNAGATGLFQIMPSVLQDYNTKNNNTIPTDSLVNDSINTDVRNWYMNDLLNRGWNIKNNPSDSVRVAKALGAYNWGSSNLVNALNKAKADGVDIYNSWDWLSYLAPETRDYIDFILMGNNNSLHRNNVAYKTKSKQNQEKVDKIKNSFDEGGNLELDQQYANQMYEQGLQQALDLGYTGTNAANFALNYAGDNLQFNAGQLPEFTVTANKPDNIHYIKDDTRPGVNRVTYNANEAKQYERDAQHNANIVGGMIAAPMLAVGAAPVAEMFADAAIGSQLYNAMVKGTTKVGNAMNTLFPGTEQFMNLYNSGKLGKTLALSLAGIEAGTESDLINSFIRNPSLQTGAQAALGAGATVGAASSTVARNIDRGMNLLSSVSKPVRDWRVALQLQYNADKMAISNKIKKVEKYFDAENRINKLIQELDYFKNEDYINSSENDKLIDEYIYRRFPFSDKYNEALDKGKKLETKAKTYVTDRKKLRDDYAKYDNLGRRIIEENTSGKHKDEISDKISFNKLSDENLYNFIQKKIDKIFESFDINSNEFKNVRDLFDVTRDKDGYPIIKLKKDKVVGGDNLDPNEVLSTEIKIHDFTDIDNLDKLITGKIKFSPEGRTMSHSMNLKTIKDKQEFQDIHGGNALQDLPKEYVEQLEKNIEYLKQLFPGFKVFGSSAGVTGAGLPHATHDIDGYMTAEDWAVWLATNKGKYKIDQISPETFKVWLKDASEVGEEFKAEYGIDINVLNAGANGNITGERAYEMYRQLHPEEYSKAAQQAIENGGEISDYIKITPKQLMDEYDSTIKTIADNFEIRPSGNKEKQLGRPFAYISYGDTKVVRKGFDMFAKSHGADEMFPVSMEELNDAKQNLEILQKIHFKGDLNAIANDPEKMKMALDWWYINRTVRARRVSNNSADTKTYLRALRDWQTGGANAHGAGLNTVALGDSGNYGPIKGYFQLHSDEDLSKYSLKDRFERIDRFIGEANYNFTNDEIKQIEEIARNNGQDINGKFKTPKDLLRALEDNTPSSKKILQEIREKLGIKSLSDGDFTNFDRYYSINETLPDDYPMMYQLEDQGLSKPINLDNRIRTIERNASFRGSVKDLIDYLMDEGPSLRTHQHGEYSNPSNEELDRPLNLLNYHIQKMWLTMNRKNPQTAKDIITGDNPFVTQAARENGLYEQLKSIAEKAKAAEKENEMLDKRIDNTSKKIDKLNNKFVENTHKRSKITTSAITGGIAVGSGTAATLLGVNLKQKKDKVENYKKNKDNINSVSFENLLSIRTSSSLNKEDKIKIKKEITKRKSQLEQLAINNNFSAEELKELRKFDKKSEVYKRAVKLYKKEYGYDF